MTTPTLCYGSHPSQLFSTQRRSVLYGSRDVRAASRNHVVRSTLRRSLCCQAPPRPSSVASSGRLRRPAARCGGGFAGAPRSAPADLSTHQITPKPMKPPILCCQISRISPRWLHEHTCGTEYTVDSLDPTHLLPISGAT